MSQPFGRIRVPLHQRHGDDLSLVRREFLHPQRLHGRQFPVYFNLGKLTD